MKFRALQQDREQVLVPQEFLLQYLTQILPQSSAAM